MKLLNHHDRAPQYCKKISVILQHCRSATLIAMLPALLSGCMGVYEGGFECPAGTGVGCKSISEVNQMINERELPKTSAKTHSEFTDESVTDKPGKCPTCGHSFTSLHGKPEIWINPLYLKERHKYKQEKPETQQMVIDG